MTQLTPSEIRDNFRKSWPEIHATLPRLPENVARDAVNNIARYDPRKAQDKAVTDRKRARSHIDKAHALLLTSHLRLLNPTVINQIHALAQVRDDVDAINLRLPASGGEALKRKHRVYTAGGCYYLMKRYAAEPSHRSGHWVWFSEAMFAIATGEHADMHEACREWAGIIAVPGRLYFLEWP
jgi:hypothetical protein